MQPEIPVSTRRLAAPAVVLILYALLDAVRTVILVSSGLPHDPRLRFFRPLLDRVGAGADVLLAGLMVAGAVGLLLHRRWGRRLLAGRGWGRWFLLAFAY